MKRTLETLTLVASAVAVAVSCGNEQLPESLIPDRPSNAPDYFCTWNLQGYVCSNESNAAQREAMNERYMFGEGNLEDWLGAFPEIRADLYFVMDDSWDIPRDANDPKDNIYLGTTILDTSRFPSFTGSPAQRLGKLVQAVKERGWRGLGGWICAQEPIGREVTDPASYWKERLMEADSAGFSYWKVDWGNQALNAEWRRTLTSLGRTHAPELWIEHAMDERFIEFSDVYRTYDVENVISQPTTLERVARMLAYHPEPGARALVNCEDEPYIAAGLGCAIGVMRHQLLGAYPDGQQDFAFPPVGRDIKQRRDEVIRGVRWHRIAEPFGVGGEYLVDSVELEDFWVLGDRETWYYWGEGRQKGDTLRAKAPARISRGLPLPEIVGEAGPERPFLLSSLYPNGAAAIAAIGRGLGRQYVAKPVEVEQQLPDWKAPIGIFGRFGKLTLVFPRLPEKERLIVMGQDLASDVAVDITRQVVIEGNRLILPQQLIDEIGLQMVSEKDVSDPGLVVQLFEK